MVYFGELKLGHSSREMVLRQLQETGNERAKSVPTQVVISV